MGFLALIPPAALWVIALVALGLFVFGLLIANHPDIVAREQWLPAMRALLPPAAARSTSATEPALPDSASR